MVRFTSGDVTLSFPLMSAIKPFMLLFLLERLGAEAVFARVGMEPSDEPFNSLKQLQADQGWPRTPCSIVVRSPSRPCCGQDARSRCESLRQWLNQRSNCQVFLDELMLSSVRAAGGEQSSYCCLLAQFGYLEAEAALDTYNHVCPISGTIQLFWGCCWCSAKRESCQNTAAQSMPSTTCGLYQASAVSQCRWDFKSGGKRCAYFCGARDRVIACWSCFRSSPVTQRLVCFVAAAHAGFRAERVWVR